MVLLAAAVALGLGAAITVSKPGTRSLAQISSYKLDLAQHNAQMALKLGSRALIDGAAEMARDARLVEILEQASARQRDLSKLQSRSQTVMTELLSYTPKKARPELMIIVDFAGKQVGRVGLGAAKMTPGQDGLVGYPLVAAALRGYQLDDTWSIDNRLFVMAAAPIVSRGRNRYVGALLLGQEVDKDYAPQLKRQLVGVPKSPLANANFAFFLRGKLLSSTIDDKRLEKLPQAFDSRRKEWREQGRTNVFSIGSGAKQRIVVLTPLVGGALAHDAFYAVTARPPRVDGLLATLGKLNKTDLPPGLWLLLGGVFLIVVILGFLLLQMEHSSPLSRLIDQVYKLSRADISRLEEHTHRGPQHRLARLINEIVDRAPKRSGKDINRILDDDKPTPGFLGSGRIEELGPPVGASIGVAHGGAMPPLARPGGSGPPSMDVIASAGVKLEGGAAIETSPHAAEDVMPLTDLEPSGGGAMQMASLDGPSGGDAMPPLASVSTYGGSSGEDPPPFALDPLGVSTDGASALPSLTPMSLPDPGLDSTANVGASLEVQVTAQKKPREPTIQGTGAPFAPLPSGNGSDERQTYFRQIYDEFIAIKRSCGESTDNVTFDRFMTKLKKNRQSLMDRYECKDVRFRVYIKDGKAALKATPVTD
ncbi:MAG: hypothetical protein CSA65_01660 [Proteobacteria bacterium]|nr:MAG: hypothetical protein CSA65_01660 [Pseudomonadota bacterium]